MGQKDVGFSRISSRSSAESCFLCFANRDRIEPDFVWQISSNTALKSSVNRRRQRISGDDTGILFSFLVGRQIFDENEYYILRCFFEDDSYDYCPSTWEQFKRE